MKDKATRERFEDPGKVGLICRDFCFENNLVMRSVQDAMIIAPPLVITRAQIDELVDRARKSLDATAAALRRH